MRGDELCVCDVAWITQLRQNLVSYHLRQLKMAGLASSRRHHQLILYRLTERATTMAEVVLASQLAIINEVNYVG